MRTQYVGMNIIIYSIKMASVQLINIDDSVDKYKISVLLFVYAILYSISYKKGI